ncbi:hypothetical protein BDD12DRAFT_819813, partial [Trichophaea hybrida]
MILLNQVLRWSIYLGALLGVVVMAIGVCFRHLTAIPMTDSVVFVLYLAVFTSL